MICDAKEMFVQGQKFKRKQTAGELSLKAMADEGKYDSLEIGHHLTEDIAKQLEICVHRHNPVFDEDEYCVGYLLASDPLLKNVMRRKFFAMLYLPSPRPNQAVFLYSKRFDRFTKRLWVLPNPRTMAELSEMPIVSKEWETMKAWSDAFFKGNFWHFIRKQHGINMLSELEYLHANREKLIKSGCKQTDSLPTEPFDFSKVATEKVIYPQKPLPKQDVLNVFRKAQSLNGDIPPHKMQNSPIMR